MNAEHKNVIARSSPPAGLLSPTRVFLIETFVETAQADLYEKLPVHRFDVVQVASSSSNLVARVVNQSPDVLVLSVDFLDATTLGQLIKLNQENPLPVVVFAKQHAPEVMKTVMEAGVSSYVVDSIEAHRLPVIMDLAIARFEKMQSLSLELEQTKERLSERKLIEKAKGIVMQQRHLSEEQAYSQMRRSAMNQSQSMVELAKRIIEVFEMTD